MIWQVKADFFFDIEDEATDFYHDCEMAFPKTRTINPHTDNAEHSIAQLIENNHEHDPNDPCFPIDSITTEP